MPAVDILVPGGGSGRYMAATLASVARQTLPDYRVVVVDNACPHPAYRKAVSRAADPRVVYRRFDQRVDAAANWQRCLSLTEAPLAAFLHDDDLWADDYLAEVTRRLAEVPEAVGVLAAHTTFTGDADTPPPFTTPPYWWQLADLPPAGRHLLLGTGSSTTHVSAFVFRPVARVGFHHAALWNADARFVSAHTRFGRLEVAPAATAFIRLHPAAGGANSNPRGMGAFENMEHNRDGLTALLRNAGGIDDTTLDQCLQVNVNPGYWFHLTRASFSWPPRPWLVAFGRRLLDRPAARRLIRQAGPAAAALIRLPWSAWVAAEAAGQVRTYHRERHWNYPGPGAGA